MKLNFKNLRFDLRLNSKDLRFDFKDLRHELIPKDTIDDLTLNGDLGTSLGMLDKDVLGRFSKFTFFFFLENI